MYTVKRMTEATRAVPGRKIVRGEDTFAVIDGCGEICAEFKSEAAADRYAAEMNALMEAEEDEQ